MPNEGSENSLQRISVPQTNQNLQTTENREDSSDFDNFRTKRIVSSRFIWTKCFERTKQTKSFRKVLQNLLKNVSEKQIKMIFRSLYYRARITNWIEYWLCSQGSVRNASQEQCIQDVDTNASGKNRSTIFTNAGKGATKQEGTRQVIFCLFVPSFIRSNVLKK